MADTLAALHTAFEKPGFDLGLDYRNNFIDLQRTPSGTLIKRAALLLNVAALRELHAGRPDAACERLADLLRLVNLQRDERLVMSQIVRNLGAAFAWSTTWELLQFPGWTYSQLAELQSAWQEMDFQRDMLAALEMERAMTLDGFRQMRDSGSARAKVIRRLEQVTDFGGSELTVLPTRGCVLHWIHVPLWRVTWVDQDALHTLNGWQRAIEGGRAARSKSWNEARIVFAGGHRDAQEPPSDCLYDRWRYLLSSHALATDTIDEYLTSRAVRMEVQRRMTVTALALERYRLRHGMLPPNLEALVPELLPAVPIDCMDGQSLRYQLRPDGSFLLYSVGEDCRDDGGNPGLPPDKKQSRGLWRGLDTVWPTPASAEETAAVLGNG